MSFEAQDLDNLFESLKKEVERVGDCQIHIAQLPSEGEETLYVATIKEVK